MPYSADSPFDGPRHLRLVLVSPGDVSAERDLVQNVLDEINHGIGRALAIHLELYRWETDAYPGFHAEGGQGLIDTILRIEDCDLLVGIFWTRFGTKIKSGETGTEHEIRSAIRSRGEGKSPQIMLYFSDLPVKPSALDRKQYEKVERFRSEMSGKGLYWLYDGPAAFASLLRRHLENWLNAEYSNPKADAGEANKPPPASLVRLLGAPEVSGVFTGRTKEFESLLEILGDAGAAPHGRIALRGMSGVGKTQIAASLARNPSHGFRTVLWIEAGTPEAFDANLADLAIVLVPGLSPVADSAIQIAAARDWLAANGGWLLVVDNAEVLDRWRGKLPSHPKSRVLLTTRHLVPADFARSIEIETLGDDDGALLLLRRAGGIPPNGKFSDVPAELAEEARRVSGRLGGLALAIDQAGAYIAAKGIAPARYLELYELKRQALHPKRTNPDHETVAVTFALALEQIEAVPAFGAAAADLVRMCAFFADEAIPEEVFTLGSDQIRPPLGELITDPAEWLEVVEVATRYSVLRRDTQPPGFGLHRLVADVLRDGLDESGRRGWMEAAIATVSAAFPEPDYAVWSLCSRLLPHVLHLSSESVGQEMPPRVAAGLVNGAAVYLRRRGRWAESRRLYEFAVASFEKYEEDHREKAALLCNMGLVLAEIEDFEAATSALEKARSLNVMREDTSDLEMASCLDNLARVHAKQGHDEEAAELWRQALELTEKSPEKNDFLVSVRLNNYAHGLMSVGCFAQAETLWLRDLGLKRSTVGERHPETAKTLFNLGSLYIILNRLDAAEQPLIQARDLLDDIFSGEHPVCAQPRLWLGTSRARRGDWGAAATFYSEALEILNRCLGPDHVESISTREDLAQAKNNMFLKK